MITKEYSKGLLYDYYPSDSNNFLYIFIHGGGLVEGDRTEIKDVAEKLSNNGISVACIDYRLYPNAKYPEFIDDCALAISEICKYAPHNNYVIGGISAGAYLAMMISFDESYLNKYGLNPSIFKKHIFDGGQSTQHFRVNEQLGLPTWNQYITEKAPIYHINNKESLKGNSYLLFAAENDLPNRKQENIDLNNLLNKKNGSSQIHIMNGYGHAEYKNTDNYYQLLSSYILKND